MLPSTTAHLAALSRVADLHEDARRRRLAAAATAGGAGAAAPFGTDFLPLRRRA
jgi:hypothetical protein